MLLIPDMGEEEKGVKKWLILSQKGENQAWFYLEFGHRRSLPVCFSRTGITVLGVFRLSAQNSETMREDGLCVMCTTVRKARPCASGSSLMSES